MNERETLLEVFHTLYARLDTLRHLEGQQMRRAESLEQYHRTLEDAYSALGKIETVIDELGQELGYHHTRLDNEVEQYSSQEEKGA
jgi:hypothetical protein